MYDYVNLHDLEKILEERKDDYFEAVENRANEETLTYLQMDIAELEDQISLIKLNNE